MADEVVELIDVSFRHKIPEPKFTNPWNKRKGPGIFKMNFSLESGKILGLVGPNGAGKTTLLRILAGIIPIDEGKIKLNGVDLSASGESIDGQLRLNVGHMPEQVRWSGNITVLEALNQFAEMRKDSISSEKLLSLVGLAGKSDASLDELSQGMRQRLSLAVALMGSPKMLLLDEPFNGLDPVAAKSVEKMIQELANKGVSIIISSHQVSGLVGFIDQLLLIHRGQIVADGTIEDIESKLGLDNRIELRGHGAIPDFTKLFGTDCVLNNHVKDSDWICIIQYPGPNAVKKIIDAGYEILEWKRKSPDIVELLCHATGLEIEDIGMELQTSDMMPLRSKTEEE
ncbi:MAG: ABC transporter ATP-binding protein [Candidatus Poseidoniaceae archaeon]